MSASPHVVLGVRRDAPIAVARRAYKRLVAKWHPDVNSAPEAEARIREINAAFEAFKNNARARKPTGGVAKWWEDVEKKYEPKPRGEAREGGAIIAGRTGRVVARWGCVRGARHAAAGLYDVALEPATDPKSVLFHIADASRARYSAAWTLESDVIQVHVRLAHGGKARSDVDLLEIFVNPDFKIP